MRFVVSALAFALIVATFALQNASIVTVSFAVWSFQTSLVLIILGSAAVGALIVLLLAAPVQFRLRRALGKATRRSAELEERIFILEAEAKQTQEQAREMNTDGK